MLKFFKILLTIVISVTLLMSCTEEQDNSSNIDIKKRKESLEKANRYMYLQEKEDINNYIERHGIDVVRTGSGLCYRVVKQGHGDRIRTDEIVSMEFEVRLLNGDLVYSSKEDGLKEFVVGRGGVEGGLEEAVLNLHRGDVAEIIIPSHLAHGLIGDGRRIKARTPIVYKVKIIDNQVNK